MSETTIKCRECGKPVVFDRTRDDVLINGNKSARWVHIETGSPYCVEADKQKFSLDLYFGR